MRKKCRLYYGIMCWCFLLLFSFQVSAARPSGNEAAVLSDCKNSAKTVKPGDVLEYSFKITDRNTASYFGDNLGRVIESIHVVWQSEKNQKLVDKYTWDELLDGYTWDDWIKGRYHKDSIEIKGKIAIKGGMCPGKWRISGIQLYSLGDEEDASIVYIGNQSLTGSTSDPDLSSLDFTVTGSKEDKKAPKIELKSMSLTRKYVKFKQKTTFRIKVADKSAIKKVTCVWRFTKKNKRVSNPYGSNEYCVMKYNKKKKCYECTMRGLEKKGIYRRLYYIKVEDIYGNEATYSRTSGKKYKKAFEKINIYSR